MALFNRNSNVWTGLALGLGATVLGPILLPAAARIAKPMAKSMVKAGILAYERGREALSELGEVAEDIVAEAQAELAEESERTAEGASAASMRSE